MPRQQRYFGKYRGKVADVADPMKLGRIKVDIPDISARASRDWAMPCFPVTGMFLVPEVGSDVWVEFEKGDPTAPVWTGIFYAISAQVPKVAQEAQIGAQIMVFQTSMGGLTIANGESGRSEIAIASAGAMIQVRDGRIVIVNGSGATIVLEGPAVDVNNGALSVV